MRVSLSLSALSLVVAMAAAGPAAAQGARLAMPTLPGLGCATHAVRSEGRAETVASARARARRAWEASVRRVHPESFTQLENADPRRSRAQCLVSGDVRLCRISAVPCGGPQPGGPFATW